MSQTADDLVDRARHCIDRIRPEDLVDVMAEGGLVVDIRPAAQRADEGLLPGALVIERNVLEWRLDPNGEHRVPEATGFDRPVVVVCSEGYASSLAAASLHQLGYERASDLIGGYRSWRSSVEVAVVTGRSAPGHAGSHAGGGTGD
jgi:rhodanese-related sulfurtransferase